MTIDSAIPAVRVHGITKHFGDLTVLAGVDLELKGREILVLLGESGSGKSTLLRVIAELTEPDAGTIEVDGQLVVSADNGVQALQVSGHQVGFVFQQYSLWPHLSVIENLSLAPRRVLRESNAAIRERACRLLAAVHLDGYEDVRPAQLSGGQRQRVAIARAVMMRPKVLLCDEVTSALDPPVAHNVLDVLTTLRDEEGLSSIVVTHDMAFAAKAADRIVYMQDGQVVEEMLPAGLGHPKSPGLRRFVEAVRWER